MSAEELVAKNRRLLKQEQPEPIRGGEVTLVSLFNMIPATVILIEPRRMLVQADHVTTSFLNGQRHHTWVRDPRGVIYGFTRRLNSKKWHNGADNPWGILIGSKQYHETSPEDL